MAINFDQWNEEFGGQDALKQLEEAKNNNREFDELPNGEYICKLDKLELKESKKHQPMLSAQFRILTGERKKSCIFYNQVMTKGFPTHKALEFLRSLQIFDDEEVDFDGDFESFNDLILDMAEESDGMRFTVEKSMDGDFQRIQIIDVE